ncbi:hypothetical protein [Rhizobium sp. 2MFCol3.1]|uniref:hypothetical protein n=1 Tax=Rhizobium sp. 2MFCol3.1 TaxID=1246459 RepID=UPI001FD9D9F8|nr:hypothetical protein [Rhizobium sp. 2MFCol3.1]
MFQTATNLNIFRDALAAHMDLAEYFLGIHAFFDGEVIFLRDVVHVNMDLAPFPVDFSNLWEWFREQLKGGTGQETFAYELHFVVDAQEDPAMEKLLEITRGTAMTIWMFDLAHQEADGKGRRFVIVTSPHKKGAKALRELFHGRDLGSD